mmetsp:Transcript_23601/g.45839  ORF Transcript_23601/g.45839 Transcript_23601/m.45839 type:complete len:206 (-) Transcript_23601:523-1140(-)
MRLREIIYEIKRDGQGQATYQPSTAGPSTAGGGLEVKLKVLRGEIGQVRRHQPRVIILIQHVITKLGVGHDHILGREHIAEGEGTLGGDLDIAQSLYQAYGARDLQGPRAPLHQEVLFRVVDEDLGQCVLGLAPCDFGCAVLVDLIKGLLRERGDNEICGEIRIRSDPHTSHDRLRVLHSNLHHHPASHPAAAKHHRAFNDVLDD